MHANCKASFLRQLKFSAKNWKSRGSINKLGKDDNNEINEQIFDVYCNA